MSRSYRRPWTSLAGTSHHGSAKQDKQYAARGVRRCHQQVLSLALRTEDYENLLLPHRLECACNDVWGWGRDGRVLPGLAGVRKDWYYSEFCRFEQGLAWGIYEEHYWAKRPPVWPPVWWIKLHRK